MLRVKMFVEPVSGNSTNASTLSLLPFSFNASFEISFWDDFKCIYLLALTVKLV